ncbi:hypothetical protein CSC88_31475, partial [Klebsiella pneumoniae]
DECYECGFTGEFECNSKGFTCPKCGNHEAARVYVIRRVCGYLGSPDARPFNAGMQEEVKRHVKHLGHVPIGYRTMRFSRIAAPLALLVLPSPLYYAVRA